jgi:hypothetical protein
MAKLTFLGLKDLNPMQQALVSAALIGIFSIGCLVFGQRQIMAWNILISPVILYAFINPVMGIFIDKDRLKYVGVSFLSFIVLGFLAYLAGSLVSFLKYSETRELVLFTFLIVLFYFLSYLLSFIFKGVLGFLEDADK